MHTQNNVNLCVVNTSLKYVQRITEYIIIQILLHLLVILIKNYEMKRDFHHLQVVLQRCEYLHLVLIWQYTFSLKSFQLHFVMKVVVLEFKSSSPPPNRHFIHFLLSHYFGALRPRACYCRFGWNSALDLIDNLCFKVLVKEPVDQILHPLGHALRSSALVSRHLVLLEEPVAVVVSLRIIVKEGTLIKLSVVKIISFLCTRGVHQIHFCDVPHKILIIF